MMKNFIANFYSENGNSERKRKESKKAKKESKNEWKQDKKSPKATKRMQEGRKAQRLNKYNCSSKSLKNFTSKFYRENSNYERKIAENEKAQRKSNNRPTKEKKYSGTIIPRQQRREDQRVNKDNCSSNSVKNFTAKFYRESNNCRTKIAENKRTHNGNKKSKKHEKNDPKMIKMAQPNGEDRRRPKKSQRGKIMKNSTEKFYKGSKKIISKRTNSKRANRKRSQNEEGDKWKQNSQSQECKGAELETCGETETMRTRSALQKIRTKKRLIKKYINGNSKRRAVRTEGAEKNKRKETNKTDRKGMPKHEKAKLKGETDRRKKLINGKISTEGKIYKRNNTGNPMRRKSDNREESNGSSSEQDERTTGLSKILKVFDNFINGKKKNKRRNTETAAKKTVSKPMEKSLMKQLWLEPGMKIKSTRFVLIALPRIQRIRTTSLVEILVMECKVKKSQISAITNSEELEGYIFLANEEISDKLTRGRRCVTVDDVHLKYLKESLKIMVEQNLKEELKKYCRPSYIALGRIKEAIGLNNSALMDSLLTANGPDREALRAYLARNEKIEGVRREAETMKKMEAEIVEEFIVHHITEPEPAAQNENNRNENEGGPQRP
ncbi:hypothetical protein GINT2_002169 [Glugoides intestinalis]